MNKILKNPILSKVVKVAFAAGLIWWMVSKGLLNLEDLKLLATPTYLAIAFGLELLNLLAVNLRWTILLQSRGFDVKNSQTLPLTFIGTFFNYAIPGSIGGDLVKAYYIAQDHPHRKVDAVTSVVVDRILGLYAMVLLALGAIVWNFSLVLGSMDLRVIGLGTIGAFLGMSLFLGATLSRRIMRFLEMQKWLGRFPGSGILKKMYKALHEYRDRVHVIFIGIGLSLVSQLIAVGFMIFVGHILGEEIPLATYFFAVPLGFIVSSIPIAPAGIGVGQYAFFKLYSLYAGFETKAGQIGITLFQGVMFIWGLLGGFFYLKKKKKPELSQIENGNEVTA